MILFLYFIKEVTSMRKRILVSVMALVLILAVATTAFADIRWIKTGNGKPANGRSGPGKDYEYITGVPYGTQVMISGASANGYTPIVLPSGSDEVYVLTKFLVTYDPGTYVPSATPSKPSGGGSSSGSSSDTAGLQSAIIKEFKAARYVTPYEVTTYHKRASGLINMRWAPSKTSKLLKAYPEGTQLRVIAELDKWYQVEDPLTNQVGFVNTAYVVK